MVAATKVGEGDSIWQRKGQLIERRLGKGHNDVLAQVGLFHLRKPHRQTQTRVSSGEGAHNTDPHRSGKLLQ